LLPGLATVPIVDILGGTILLVAVALLDLAFELIKLAIDDIEIIVSQLAPLLLDLTLDLLPVSSTRFQSILSSCFRMVMAEECAERDFDPCRRRKMRISHSCCALQKTYIATQQQEMSMTINIKNPIADLRKSKGYSLEQLSLISGLTVAEITKLETGVLVDPAKLARLMTAAGIGT
jgi:hypothetical protein